jgi:hypothetical protein
VTAFWCPALQNCPSKHYHPGANRALPAVIIGIIGEVGEIGDRRIACPLAFERIHLKDPREIRLWQDLLRWVHRRLASDEVAVIDASVKLADMQAAEIEFYVLRLATNFTGRRNHPASHCGKGRKPVCGKKVLPLARTYQDKTIAATPPDRIENWTEEGVSMRAEIWENLVLPRVIPGAQAKTFDVYIIYDPA